MKNLVFIVLLFVSLSSNSNDSNYVFGWTQLKDAELKKPRGGTSVGTPLICSTSLINTAIWLIHNTEN